MLSTARSRRAKDQYAGSALSELNAARSRTASLRPLRLSDPDAQAMLLNPKKAERITTIADLTGENAKVDTLAGNYESHLLVADPFNPGYFLKKPLYDHAEAPQPSGDYLCDVHEGQLLLPADTLVYWA